MNIKDIEEFIREHLSKENNNQVMKSFEELTLKEIFCLDLKYVCKAISQSIDSSYRMISSFSEKYGLIYNKNTNWFYVNNKTIGNGSFIPANRLFHNAPCSSSKCHRCSYIFALNYEDSVVLKAGLINPFCYENSFLHSVCEINLDNEKFIFDGANYLVMSKNLYYDIFKFQELSCITKNELISDYIELSGKPIINIPADDYNCYNIKNVFNSNIKEKFKGLSFCTYLYGRKTFMDKFKSNGIKTDSNNAKHKHFNEIDNTND